MRQWYCAAVRAALSMALLAGCSGKPATPPGTPQLPEGQTAATPEQLVEIWDSQVAKPREELNFKLAHAVAQDMSVRHPQGIEPILRKIDVETPTAQAVVLTLAATRDLIEPKHEALLSELAATGKPVTTRLVAIDLLGSIDNDSVRNKLLELEKDPDLLVSVAAYLAHLHLADAEYAKRMPTYWNNPEVHDASRQEMMRRIPDSVAMEVMDLLGQTVLHVDWAADVRQRILSILGNYTDTRALDALKAAADATPEPQLREFAKKAADAMQARIDSGETGTTQTTPSGDTITTAPLEIQGTPGQTVTSIPLTAEPGNGTPTTE